MTNTDLKLKYGILNFKKLSEYDDNFTKLDVYKRQHHGCCIYQSGVRNVQYTVLPDCVLSLCEKHAEACCKKQQYYNGFEDVYKRQSPGRIG